MLDVRDTLATLMTCFLRSAIIDRYRIQLIRLMTSRTTRRRTCSEDYG